MNLRFPAPLQPGDTLALCAVSSGVPEVMHARLDASIAALRAAGYLVVEGDTLRRQEKNASASAATRLAELNHFLYDPAIKAVLPPWGGELAMQLLAGLDWPRLAALPPKWLCGFSDISTLAVPLTLRAGWATLHSPNVFDISHPDRQSEMQALWYSWQHGLPPRQQAFTHFWPFGDPGVAKSSRVRVAGAAQASMSGRLIGGCLDTLSRLAATPYFDLQAWRGQPVLLYLENCELAPCELARALTAMRLTGIFDGLAGLILGRSSGPEAQQAHELQYEEAVMQALGDLPCPLVLDADIGHVPPQWTLMNGAWATLHVQHGHATLEQYYHPATTAGDTP